MMDYSQVKNFLAFIEIDTQITELESDKVLVEKELSKANQLIESSKNQISHNNSLLHNLKKKQHSFELELKTINAQEADKKIKLERISNSREFFALNNELEDLIKRKKELEDEYLKSWQEFETLEKELLEVNKNLEFTIAHEEKEIENFKRRITSIENRLKDNNLQRESAIKLVDPELLNQYISMRQSTKNPVVKAKRDSCGGCFYILSPQDLASLKLHKLIRCKNCYRIVYNPEEPAE